MAKSLADQSKQLLALMATSSADDSKKFLPLMHLNHRSSRVGQFKLIVFIHFRRNTSTRGTTPQTASNNFNCILVDESDKSSYCNAQFKLTKTNQQQFEQAEKKFTNGARFIFSNVVFHDHAKKMYLNASVKIMLDLANSRSEQVKTLAPSSASAVQPWPELTISALVDLTESQCFDISVLICGVSEKRQVNPTRSVFDVDLMDGTTDDDTARTRIMKLTLFAAETDVDRLMEEANKARETKQPLSVFQHSGRTKTRTMSIRSRQPVIGTWR